MTKAAQKYNRPGAIVSTNTRHPNPEYFGFEWKALRPLLDEHAGLAAKKAEASNSVRDLEKKLEQEEALLPTNRAKAIRAGESFDPSYIEDLKAELEDARGNLEAIQRAGNMVEKDLQEAIKDNAPDYLEEVQERRREVEAEAEIVRQRLAVVEWEANAMDRLDKYLSKPMGHSGRYTWMGHGARPEVDSGGE